MAPEDPGETAAAPPLKILLVEDDEFDVAVFGRAFRQSEIPVEIIRCRRGEEVLEGLRDAELSIDLLVADHLLPGISGFDLCLELLEDEPAYALVLLTGGGSEQMAIRALRAGIHDYIVKDSTQEYLRLLPLVLPRVARRHRARQAQKAARTPGQPEVSLPDLADCADVVRRRGGTIWLEEGNGGEPALHFSVPLAPAEVDGWRPGEGQHDRRLRDQTDQDQRDARPSAAVAAADAPDPPAGAPPADQPPKRVLIAHSNPIVQFVASRAVERLGYRFVTVESGHKALEALERESFDIALMGVRMPGLDGLETTRAIRDQQGEQRYLPIIALGVGPADDEAEQCLNAGMDDQVARPISFEGLSAVLLRAAATGLR